MRLRLKMLEQMGKNGIRTIEELHIKTGLSRNVISDLLNNKKPGVRFSTLEKLCRVFNCSIDDLIEMKKE